MKTTFKRLAGIALATLCLSQAAFAASPEKPECIAPAKPGGGFDLTCKLAQSGLQQGNYLSDPIRVSYMPGGIGAVAYNAIVAQRPDEAGTIIAFSGGSLLNLAQKKFGKYGVNDVRWLAAVGADFGMIAVRSDSPYKTLGELMAALKKDPTAVVFGAGGTIGSQDWMKAALIARQADVDYKRMRYVAFEGGGETLTALLGGHIQAYTGDVAEIVPHLEAGKIRVLAVLADERLDGPAANLPTAKEQGFDISWPIIRGFYMGPKVSDADFDWWVKTFNTMMATPEFAKLRAERGLFPFNKTGAALDAFVKERVSSFQTLAKEFGLVK
ncbi:MAG: tripartite tricarboxylate transporter substrate binding protein [Burkholderiaceae bacterium]